MSSRGPISGRVSAWQDSESSSWIPLASGGRGAVGEARADKCRPWPRPGRPPPSALRPAGCWRPKRGAPGSGASRRPATTRPRAASRHKSHPRFPQVTSLRPARSCVPRRPSPPPPVTGTRSARARQGRCPCQIQSQLRYHSTRC